MDVKLAFLSGFHDEEVYIEQPKGYGVRGHEDKVLRLKKAMYKLKQVPRTWNSRIDNYFQEKGFEKCPHKHALYIKMNGKGNILIVCLYVDDLIFTGNCVKMFDDFKKEIAKEFEMINIGLMSYYLGIEVKQKDDEIFISQEAYAKEMLKRFNMKKCNSISISIQVLIHNIVVDTSGGIDCICHLSGVGEDVTHDCTWVKECDGSYGKCALLSMLVLSHNFVVE
ncbi:hypothetical protein RJ639_046425 [Escallonia herrerae]|uniref:Reverse transcriptase Ty1/copia-type domain-containing protein n=1 Tax=Escallonia herrerae TaxID=1293975 RepID=A0AA89B3K1_9ASTE|nr:hypothetical protein RJ639_046425 [Escallonia herrerae]